MNEELMSSAFSGMCILLTVQVFSKGMTFILNLAMTRFVDPTVYGVATVQFQLLVGTVVFLSREGMRRACLRGRPGQGTVNVAWLALPIGTFLAPLSCYFLVSGLSTSDSSEALEIPSETYALAFGVVAIAAVLELVVEPVYVLLQGELSFRGRALAEGSGLFFRVLFTFVGIFLFGEGGGGVQLLVFALSQVVYSVVWCVVLVYSLDGTLRSRQSKGKYTEQSAIGMLFPTAAFRAIAPRPYSAPTGDAKWFDAHVLKLFASFTWQSFEKYLLTEGERLVLVITAPPLSDQGVFGLVTNLGSLVARFLFQPVEEASFALFSKLASTSYAPDKFIESEPTKTQSSRAAPGSSASVSQISEETAKSVSVGNVSSPGSHVRRRQRRNCSYGNNSLLTEGEGSRGDPGPHSIPDALEVGNTRGDQEASASQPGNVAHKNHRKHKSRSASGEQKCDANSSQEKDPAGKRVACDSKPGTDPLHGRAPGAQHKSGKARGILPDGSAPLPPASLSSSPSPAAQAGLLRTSTPCVAPRLLAKPSDRSPSPACLHGRTPLADADHTDHTTQGTTDIKHTTTTHREKSKGEQFADAMLALWVLSVVLKILVYIGLVFACFGPSYCGLLLRLLYGDRWTSGAATNVLSTYCGYILIMGANGVTEAFVHATSRPHELRRLNKLLIVFSAAYLCFSIGLTRTFATQGLVLANMCSLSLRTLYSLWYISCFYRRYLTSKKCPSVGSLLSMYTPSLPTLACFLLSSVACARAGDAFCPQGDCMVFGFTYVAVRSAGAHVAVGVLCLAVVVLTAWFSDRAFLGDVRRLWKMRRSC
eukprot:Rmarinus@m.12372